jgi:hypothetical protein
MAKLVAARAWCNNEVAYLVWKSDGKIDGCLGFMITRIHLDLNGAPWDCTSRPPRKKRPCFSSVSGDEADTGSF